MTREEAIEILKDDAYVLYEDDSPYNRQAYDMAIEALKKKKSGKWMWIPYEDNPEIGNWHCSQCFFMPAAFNLAKKHLRFCPNCGADMRGEE